MTSSQRPSRFCSVRCVDEQQADDRGVDEAAAAEVDEDVAALGGVGERRLQSGTRVQVVLADQRNDRRVVRRELDLDRAHLALRAHS